MHLRVVVVYLRVGVIGIVELVMVSCEEFCWCWGVDGCPGGREHFLTSEILRTRELWSGGSGVARRGVHDIVCTS